MIVYKYKNWIKVRYKEVSAHMATSKEKFFELFVQYFYYLWY